MYQLCSHVNISTLTGANNVLKTAGTTLAILSPELNQSDLLLGTFWKCHFPNFQHRLTSLFGFHIISPLLRLNLLWSPQGQTYTSIQTHTSHTGITLSCNSILTLWHLGHPVTLDKHMHITRTHVQKPTRFAHHLHCLACSICRAGAVKWTGSFPIQPLAIWWPGLALVIDGICRCVHGEGPWGPGMADLKHTEIHMGVGRLVGRRRC